MSHEQLTVAFAEHGSAAGRDDTLITALETTGSDRNRPNTAWNEHSQSF